MSSLICALIFVGYMETISITLHNSREEAVQEAIYRADDLYNKSFSTFADIEKYEEDLFNSDGTEEVMVIKCNTLIK